MCKINKISWLKKFFHMSKIISEFDYNKEAYNGIIEANIFSRYYKYSKYNTKKNQEEHNENN